METALESHRPNKEILLMPEAFSQYQKAIKNDLKMNYRPFLCYFWENGMSIAIVASQFEIF